MNNMGFYCQINDNGASVRNGFYFHHIKIGFYKKKQYYHYQFYNFHFFRKKDTLSHFLITTLSL